MRNAFSLAMVALGFAAVASGCHFSQDQHSFPSTMMEPKTVEIVDVPRDEVIWAMDIPVGQKLIIDLDRGDRAEVFRSSDRPAETMFWQLFDLPRRGHTKGPLREQLVQLEGRPIRIEWYIREPGEQPTAMLGGPLAEPTGEAAQPAEEDGDEFEPLPSPTTQPQQPLPTQPAEEPATDDDAGGEGTGEPDGRDAGEAEGQGNDAAGPTAPGGDRPTTPAPRIPGQENADE